MAINTLQAVLDKAKHEEVGASKSVIESRRTPSKLKAVTKVEVETDKFYRPGRDGRRFIGGHFAPEVAKHLRLISVEDETTVQALLEEALELLFLKKGRNKLATLVKKQ